jgi:hypothetical protein
VSKLRGSKVRKTTDSVLNHVIKEVVYSFVNYVNLR